MKFRPELAGLVAGSVAFGTVLTGCGGANLVRNTDASKDDIAAICAPENALPLPSAANITTFVDKRAGNIYPCLYLNDMGIPFNKPTKLNKVEQGNVHSEKATITGSIANFILVGAGQISGNAEVTDSPVTIFNFTDNDGFGREVVVARELVRTKFCPDECAPTVTIKVPNTPLWNKAQTQSGTSVPETSSIWLAYDDIGVGKERHNVIAGLALRGPSDVKNGTDNFTGGPDRPGRVISTLATSIDITLPASAEKAQTGETAAPVPTPTESVTPSATPSSTATAKK